MLTAIDEGVYAATGEHWMGAICFPVRMVVLGGVEGVRIWSPIALTDELAAAVAALGPVRALVAPNCAHHSYLGPWRERFPDARLHAPPGLQAKRRDLTVDVELDGTQSPWSDVELCPIDGAPAVNELVMLHRPTRSLLVADLVFNLREVRGLMTRLAFTLTGVHGQLIQSKLWRWALTKDRAAAGASVERILTWDFRRLIVAHGEIAEGAGPAELAAATRWMRGAP